MKCNEQKGDCLCPPDECLRKSGPGDPPPLTKAQIDEVVEALRGSCLSLATVLEQHGLPDDADMQDTALTEAIDAELFNCDTCGWWCELSEASETELDQGNGICTDCAPAEEDE